MKSAFGKLAVVILMSFFIAGCSSIRARTETLDKNWTVYPGIRQDVKDTSELFSRKSSDPGWMKGVMTTLYIIDLPFSAVFDTVVMPYDLYRILTSNDAGTAH